MTPEPAAPGRRRARAKTNRSTARSDVPASTFGHYGKQAVNPLAFLMDFLLSLAMGSFAATPFGRLP
jgi:hypothetical protein